MATLFFTVTNDLNTDQRMIRICSTLVAEGHDVLLVGRSFRHSSLLAKRKFNQKRIACFFKKGFLSYAEFNIRLYFFLLMAKKPDLICAIDLDTILPCLWISKLRGIKRVYDAHELFCEMKEVVDRPRIYRFWKRIEQYSVRQFKYGYTVNQHIADEFKRMYGVDYGVIRSMSEKTQSPHGESRMKKIIYQGSVNEGRCFEQLIPAMKMVDAELHIYGNGNFMQSAQSLVKQHGLNEKIIFNGVLSPDLLRMTTPKYYIGITLFEPDSKNNLFSLANRFFDYLHAGVPQLTSDFPVYREMNKQHEIALLISDLSPVSIANNLNLLLQNEDLWLKLHKQCAAAAAEWNWENESIKLNQIYCNVLA